MLSVTARLLVVLLTLVMSGGSSPISVSLKTTATGAALISEHTGLWLLKQSRARLSGRPTAVASEEPIPHEAQEPRQTQIFITPYLHGCVICPTPGTGLGDTIAEALNSALNRISTSLISGRNRALQPEPDRIQIDILDGPFVPINKPVASNSRKPKLSAIELIDPGVDGVAIDVDGRTYYLLPSQMLYQSIFEEVAGDQTAEELLGRLMKHINFGAEAWRSPYVKLRRFRTISFVEDGVGRKALRIQRGCVQAGDLNRSRLFDAARQGGDYLVRMQQPDGSFYYSYDPVADRTSRRTYNILRHAGTTFSLFELYTATRERQYLTAARLGVKFLKTRFRPVGQGGRVYVLDNDGKAKLGGNGLALLALTSQLEVDLQFADPDGPKSLAAQILAMQRRDGSFASYHRLRGDEPEGSVSLYYPGEAILGLMRLHKTTGDRRLIAAARRGADYLVESQTRGGVLPPDAWLMQALEALFRAGRDRKYAEHAIALAEAMITDQYTESDALGYSGGFRPGLPRATPAASRSEGMLSAYRIALTLGDPRAERIAEALRASARFQLTQQFDEANSFFLAKPERALGGFRAGVTSMRVRIDFVQHNISSLLGIARTLY